MLTRSRLPAPRRWTRPCPSLGSCSRGVSSCLRNGRTDGRTDGELMDWWDLKDVAGRPLSLSLPLRRCLRSPSAPLTLFHSLIKAWMRWVTSCHLSSLFLRESSLPFFFFLFFSPLCDSALPVDQPPRAHGNLENSQAASVFQSLASDPGPLALSPPLLFLSTGSLCLSQTSQWQSRTLAFGEGLPVLAPPLLLSVPPPSL